MILFCRSRIIDDHDHENRVDTAAVFSEPEEPIARSSNGSNFIGFDEDGKSEFTFGFKFQMKEEDLMSYESRLQDSGDASQIGCREGLKYKF